MSRTGSLELRAQTESIGINENVAEVFWWVFFIKKLNTWIVQSIITGDETWVYEYEVETLQQSSDFEPADILDSEVYFESDSKDLYTIREIRYIFLSVRVKFDQLLL